jgi:hypothetical protein
MYVGALAMNTTEKSLTDYFSQFGDVSNCQVGLIFFTLGHCKQLSVFISRLSVSVIH